MDKDELVRRRTALGLSRPELAREIGVSEVTVWRWEVEGRKPTAAIGKLLEQALRKFERRSAAQRGEGGGDGSVG